MHNIKMNTKTYKVHTCDFYSSLILKKRQEGKPKKKEGILCNKCKYVTVGCLVNNIVAHIMKFSSTLLIWETIQRNTKPNYCYNKILLFLQQRCLSVGLKFELELEHHLSNGKVTTFTQQ